MGEKAEVLCARGEVSAFIRTVWHALAIPLRQRAGVYRVAKIRASRVVWELVQRGGYEEFSVAIGPEGYYCAREREPLAREKTR